MKKILLMFLPLLAAFALGGCAQVAPGSTPVTAAQVSPAQLQANWLQACLAYEGAQKALLANIHRLSKPQLQQALMVTHQITPICQKQPANLQQATVQITSAVTTITILGAAQATGVLK